VPETSRWKRKDSELDVGTRNQSINRLKTQQYETRKNDEFSAMGREIERFQQEISKLEDQELELMEQADQLRAQIAAEEKETASTKQLIARQMTNLDEKKTALGRRLEELKKEREELAAKVDEDFYSIDSIGCSRVRAMPQSSRSNTMSAPVVI
jgi:predicted  nucleic acid-binding Zn-ribbon protein